MLATPHVLVGAAIGTKVLNPLLALVLGFVSHFILDGILHWSVETNPKKNPRYYFDGTIDLMIGLLLVYLILPDYKITLSLILGILGGVLPDLISAAYHSLGLRRKRLFHKIHGKIQVETSGFWGGLWTQLIVSIAAILCIVFV